MDLTEKLRSGHVRRWHIVAVSREQTIADHMYRVGTITEEILRMLDLFDWDSSLTLNAMRWAAIHDRHEFRLGDLPTPGKEALVEFYGGKAALDGAAERMDEEYAELVGCIGPQGECPLAGYVVKYADLLEAMNYVGIFGCGRHAREVWRGLQVSAAQAWTALVDALRPPVETSINMGRWQNDADKLAELIPLLREGQHWS